MLRAVWFWFYQRLCWQLEAYKILLGSMQACRQKCYIHKILSTFVPFTEFCFSLDLSSVLLPVDPLKAARRCSYVSFLDDSLIREEAHEASGLSGGVPTLCMHFTQCGVLKSTLSGSATFRVSGDSGDSDEGRKWPQDDNLVTISTARSMSSKSKWQLRKQLCVEPQSFHRVELKDSCPDYFEVKLLPGNDVEVLNSMVISTITVAVTIQRGKDFLCRQSATSATSATSNVSFGASNLWLSETCAENQHLWDIVRSGENQQQVDSEPCVWLRAHSNYSFKESEYLSWTSSDLSQPSGPSEPLLVFRPWSQDMSASCWNFGFEQTWMHHNFVRRDDFTIGAVNDDVTAECDGENVQITPECQTKRRKQWLREKTPNLKRRKAVPHIWLMASPKYDFAMQRLLSTFRRAKEPLRVSIRWVPDFKDTTREGFHLSGFAPQGRKVFAFNYLKLLFLFESYLDAVQSQDEMVAVMDLDVQVYLGMQRVTRVI